jgi:hypothetical protein
MGNRLAVNLYSSVFTRRAEALRRRVCGSEKNLQKIVFFCFPETKFFPLLCHNAQCYEQICSAIGMRGRNDSYESQGVFSNRARSAGLRPAETPLVKKFTNFTWIFSWHAFQWHRQL